jgi:hypothetical protein
MAKEVKDLRKFRDNILLTNSPGRWLVKFYSSVSPPIANFIAKHNNLRRLVRWSLLALVGVSWMALRINVVPTVVLVILLLALMITFSAVCFNKLSHPYGFTTLRNTAFLKIVQ